MRRLPTIAAILVVAAVAPSSAQALTLHVAGDDDRLLALGPAIGLRGMELRLWATPGAENYRITVLGPNGAVVADTRCASGSRWVTMDYVGNGTYTVRADTYALADARCSDAATAPRQSFVFGVGAGTVVTGAAKPVLTRRPGTSVITTVRLPINVNPGAVTQQVIVGRNVLPGADGGLPGSTTTLIPDLATNTVAVALDRGPGTYVVVARAQGPLGQLNPQTFSPWSRPAFIRAYAPFDLAGLRFPDASGPMYSLRATINERAAHGRVQIAIARGRKGAYRSIGDAPIRRRSITKRFWLTRPGTYRVRFTYKGNARVAPGFEVRKVRIAPPAV